MSWALNLLVQKEVKGLNKRNEIRRKDEEENWNTTDTNSSWQLLLPGELANMFPFS
jgi:hypothetical protein